MYSKFICLCMVITNGLAAPHTDEVPAERQQPTVIPILSLSAEYEPDGKFKYSYETGNGIKREETAYDKEVPEGKPHSDCSNEGGEDNESGEIHVQKGSYSYTAPDGSLVSVSYIADENGFQPINERIQYRSHDDKKGQSLNSEVTKKPTNTETLPEPKRKVQKMKFGDRLVSKSGKYTKKENISIKNNESIPPNKTETTPKSSVKNSTVTSEPMKTMKNQISVRDNNVTDQISKQKEMLHNLSTSPMEQTKEKGKNSILQSVKPTNKTENPVENASLLQMGNKSEHKKTSNVNGTVNTGKFKDQGNTTNFNQKHTSNKTVPSTSDLRTLNNNTSMKKEIPNIKATNIGSQNKNDKNVTQKKTDKKEIHPQQEKENIFTTKLPESNKNTSESNLEMGKNKTTGENSSENMGKSKNDKKDTMRNILKPNNSEGKSIDPEKNQDEILEKTTEKSTNEGQKQSETSKNPDKKAQSSKTIENTPARKVDKTDSGKHSTEKDENKLGYDSDKTKRNETNPKEKDSKANPTDKNIKKLGKTVHNENLENPNSNLNPNKDFKNGTKAFGVNNKNTGGDKGLSDGNTNAIKNFTDVPSQNITKPTNNQTYSESKKEKPKEMNNQALASKSNQSIEKPDEKDNNRKNLDMKKNKEDEKQKHDKDITDANKGKTPSSDGDKKVAQTENHPKNNENSKTNKSIDKKEPNPQNQESTETKNAATINDTAKTSKMLGKENATDNIKHHNTIPDKNTKKSNTSEITPDSSKEIANKNEKISNEEEIRPKQDKVNLGEKEKQPNPKNETESPAMKAKSEKVAAHATDVIIKAAGVAENAADKAVKAADVAENAADAAQKAALETEKIAEAAKHPGNHSRELVLKAAKEHAKLAEDAAQEAINAAKKADTAAEDAKKAAKTAQSIVKSVQSPENTKDTEQLLRMSENLTKDALSSAQDAGIAAHDAQKENNLSKIKKD